jgi:lipopolysaccharide export LptBFGC system permease protein LptF
MDSIAQRQVKGITWLRADDGSIVKMDIYIPSEDSFRGVTIFSASENRINRIISAKKAKYIEEEEGWLLKGVVDYTPASGKMKRMNEMIWRELGPHNALLKQVKRPFHMNYFELSQYLKRLRSMGFVNVRLDVELYSKLSYPLVNMIVLLLGVSFAARRNVGGLFAATFSLMFALAYWFGHTMLLTMGYAGIIHPMVAVWLMPVVFGVIAVQQFMGVPE